MTSDVFRYFAYDLNTNTRICEVPARDVDFDTRYNDAGAYTGTLDLQAPGVANQVSNLLGYNGIPFKLYADRDGTIVWGGIVWTGDYSKSEGVLPIGGREFLSYFQQRTQAKQYSLLEYPSGLDPAALAAMVVNDAQSVALCGPGASIGLQVVGGSSTLAPIVPGYPLAQAVTVATILSDLNALQAPGVGGIDISITSQWDANGNPVDTLRIWSPRVGRSAGSTGLVLDLSSALDYTWPTDASRMATNLNVTGAGTGSALLSAPVVSPLTPVGGLGQSPRLDRLFSYPSVQSQSQLSQMANGVAQQYGAPVATPTVTVPTALAGQPLGSWITGDDFLLQTAGDERFPTGLSQYWRCVQTSVKVPSEGVATAVLTFNAPPIF